jgi:hypothetical protein
VDIKGLGKEVIQIFGHTHTKKEYVNKIIVGVPLITRHGEENNPIIQISENKKIEYVNIPVFIDIKTIQFGEPMENENYIYNIINAPSYSAVYEKYPVENIRHEGISVLVNDEESEENVFYCTDSSFTQVFSDFSEESKVPQAEKNMSIKYLGELG